MENYTRSLSKNGYAGSNRKEKYKIKFSQIALVFCVLFYLIPRTENIKYLIILGILILIFLLNGKIIKLHRMPWYMLIYVTTYILSYILHFYGRSIIEIFIFLAYFFVMREVLFNSIKDYKSFNAIINYFVIIFSTYALLGIIEAITGFNLFDLVFNRTIEATGANSVRYGIIRWHGLCTNSINNGMLLTVILALAGYRLFNFNAKSKKALWSVCYFLLCIGIILSMSRAVIFIAFVSQLIIASHNGFKKLAKRCLFVFLTVCIINLLMNGSLIRVLEIGRSMFSAIFSSTIDAQNGIGGVGNRFQLWDWVYDAVENNLMLGMGFEKDFSQSVPYTTGYGYWTKTSIEVHWLSVLYEKGLFGLTGFIIFELGCIKSLWKNRKVYITNKHSGFPFMMLIISVGYFMALFTFTGFEDLQFYYLLFFLYEIYLKISLSSTVSRKSTD